jgi:hypothetical protein
MLDFAQAGQPGSFAFRFGPVEELSVARTATTAVRPSVRLGPQYRGPDRFEGSHQRFVVPASSALLARVDQCTTVIQDAAWADATLRDVLISLPPPAQHTHAIARG